MVIGLAKLVQKYYNVEKEGVGMKRFNNKGFSLVELIIVIAIMAVLVGVLAPNFIKYVSKSQRSIDVTNASRIVETMDVLLVMENASNNVGGHYMSGFMWDKNATIGAGTDIYSQLFQTLGTVPISEFDEDLLWMMNYSVNSHGYCEVKYLFLVETPGSTSGYQLYPDHSEYLYNSAMTPIP